MPITEARCGGAAVEQLHRGLLPVVRITTVDDSTHGRAERRWLTERPRKLSLVDVTSFVVMRDQGLADAFAHDDDFAREGFSLWE